MGKKKFDINDYTMVKDRLKWYKDEHPDYRIETDVVAYDDELKSVIIKAWIYKNVEEQERRLPHATGIAEELRDAGFINKTSHVENAETSAIGRALANIDYHGSDKRPSKEEMDKVERTKKVKEPKTTTSEKTNADDDVVETIQSFDDADELVDWFNTQIGNRSGNEIDSFRGEYLPAVREQMAKLED